MRRNLWTLYSINFRAEKLLFHNVGVDLRDLPVRHPHDKELYGM